MMLSGPGQPGRLAAFGLELFPNEVLGLVGPNGSGKSTLLGELARHPAWGNSEIARARKRAVVTQATRALPWRISEVVAMGRIPWGDDGVGVTEALAAWELADRSDRLATQLSGGEWARVALARAWAQRPAARGYLLLDEPTAAMDTAWQERTFSRLRELAKAGTGVIVAVHDLDLAGRSCDRVAVLHRGEICALGPAAEVLVPTLLQRVWATPFLTLSVHGKTRILPESPDVPRKPAASPH